MMRAQKGSEAAPFAAARQEGFVFRTGTMRRAFDALDHAFSERVFPAILAGPAGLGKRTALGAWVDSVRTAENAIISLRSDSLTPGRVAEVILAGFGLQPMPGSPAKDALLDYLEDCTAAGQKTAVLILDLHRLEPEALGELAQLAARRGQGGVGLPLIATTDDADTASDFSTPPLVLGGMMPDEIESLADQLLGGRMTISQEAAEDIWARTAGLIGEVGPLLDEACARAREEGAGRISVRHLDDAPEPTRREEKPNIPSPEDIERALLALDEPAPAEPKKPSYETLRETEEQSLEARLERSFALDFPKIERRQPKLPEGGPANDPKAGLDPAVVEGLKGVARELAELQGHLAYIRSETEALQAAAAERRQKIREASEAFVKSLREPAERASGE